MRLKLLTITHSTLHAIECFRFKLTTLLLLTKSYLRKFKKTKYHLKLKNKKTKRKLCQCSINIAYIFWFIYLSVSSSKTFLKMYNAVYYVGLGINNNSQIMSFSRIKIYEESIKDRRDVTTKEIIDCFSFSFTCFNSTPYLSVT